ncbi:21 kDa hemolysin precursor (plasmid) [Legionella adelaidensis]|uniref:21 kDa hemolysin n=1 Tax=Legionella adelaidensis TaxID=45056 RepID=A0A0W0R199_9GAMM|nr:BON domain-containing protein [Legionella adelaidensis]KTC64854.1 putative periplasmic or secreted lipoprotein [Legionella adelaidensis]VEH82975.1 21 kDa hemolysin precursor [Legionella adelaidensis]
MNKKIILVLISSLLAGCVAAVVVGAAGLVVYDRRSVFTIENDARIFYQVNKNIAGDPQFKGSHIVISSFNQSVLLVGEVPTTYLKDEAAKIAKTTPNVYRVYNQISIENPTTIAQRSKDTWITGQVRAEMLTKKGLESGSIRVVTENSVVYLLGIVTKEQSGLAVDVARQVPGVTKVVKVFRYIM